MSLADYEPNVRDEFLNDLQREDEVGLVLRAHIHIEHAIIELLEAGAPNSNLLKKANLNYDRKIIIAAAFNMIRADLLEPLEKIGKLRNKFAHRLGYKLSSEDVVPFINAFPKEDRKLMERIYADTRAKSPAERPEKFGDLSAGDKLILAVVVLRQALIAEYRISFS